MTQPLAVDWPPHYHPNNTPIHVRNELEMAAPPDRVWAWLVRAPLWPTWYVNSANVQILDGSGPDLHQGTRFRWRTFGVTISSTVLEIVPGERIAWDAHSLGVDAYHGWVLQPSAKGCIVVTEETQHGFVARLGKLLMPGRMFKFHQIWLDALAVKAAGGLPPATT